MKNTAIITGASTGIGRELARIHAKRNGDLIIIARNKAKLEELKNELQKEFGVKVICISKDLSVNESADEIYTEIKSREISIEYLINNAGFGGHGYFHERNWDSDLQMINLNIITLTKLTRLFLPEMLKNKKGKILNVSSTASLMPGPLQAVYFATKAFVTSFSNAINEELRGKGVSVSALLPGATNTEFANSAGLNNTDLFKDAFSAKYVAEKGYKGMMKSKLNIIAGLSFTQKIMFLIMPLIPKRVILKTIKKMQEI
ncbi:MAG: SDR family oxidoreductase [Marinifilaceae bacterium]|jgi:short-subunit dehydrogenase|nr:SDR family oxidoreductase [Marinifilaceae bacterium]